MKKSQIRNIAAVFLSIVILQYFVRLFLIQPFYEKAGIELQMSGFQFFLIVLATALVGIAACFQVIYYDHRVQNLSTANVQKSTQLEKIFNISFLLEAVGCLSGIFAAWHIGFLNLGFLFVMLATLMYFYALRYKRLFFWGNFCIALLPFIVISFVWLFEYFATRQQPSVFASLMVNNALKPITLLLGFYGILIGVLVYLWQIVEQTMQWQEDPYAPSVSFADKFGIKNAKILLAGLFILLTVFLILIAIKISPFFGKYVVWGNALFFSCSLIFSVYKLYSLTQKQDYLLIVNILKVLLILAVLSMLEFYFFGFIA